MKFPPSTFESDSTYVKDSIVVVHDTIIIEGSQVLIRDTIPCPELEYHAEVKKNHLTAKVSISKGKLSVECIADSLKKIIEVQSHIITTYREEKSREVIIPSCEHEATKFDKFCYWWFGVTALLGLLYGVFKFYKP